MHATQNITHWHKETIKYSVDWHIIIPVYLIPVKNKKIIKVIQLYKDPT